MATTPLSLLHLDGSGTTLVQEVAGGPAWAFAGSAGGATQQSTTKRWGTGAAFVPKEDVLQSATLGATASTYSFWVKSDLSSNGGQAAIISQGNQGDAGAWALLTDNTPQLWFVDFGPSISDSFFITGSAATALRAMINDGCLLVVTISGGVASLAAAADADSTITVRGSGSYSGTPAGRVVIGSRMDGGGSINPDAAALAYVDEVFITGGDPLYTFPADNPTGPYTLGGGDVTVALSGVAATGALGTPGEANLEPLSFVLGTGAVGTPGNTNAFGLSNVLATGAVGTLGEANTEPLDGVQAAGEVGTVTVEGSPDVVVGLTGNAATGAVGTIGDITARALSNVLGTGQVGTVTASGGDAPVPPAGTNAGFVMGPRTVYLKPLLQRVLDERTERRVRPKKDRAARRAREIERQAAALVLEDGSEQQLADLMAAWLAQAPVLTLATGFEIDPMQAFMAQIAFRLEQQRAAQAEAERLRFMQDEEDAIALLLL